MGKPSGLLRVTALGYVPRPAFPPALATSTLTGACASAPQAMPTHGRSPGTGGRSASRPRAAMSSVRASPCGTRFWQASVSTSFRAWDLNAHQSGRSASHLSQFQASESAAARILRRRPKPLVGCLNTAVRLREAFRGRTLEANRRRSAAMNNRTSNAIRLVSTPAMVAHVRLPHARLRLRSNA